MTYKVSVSGKDYILPARTLSVDEQIEFSVKTDKNYSAGEITRRDAVCNLHGFVEALIPGALPPVDEVDTNELMKVCADIIAAYNTPAMKARVDAQMAQAREVLNRPEMQKLLAAAPYTKK